MTTPPGPPGDPPGGDRPLPFRDSICHECRHHRYVVGHSSTFIRCLGLPVKYPAQPVRACPAFERSWTPS